MIAKDSEAGFPTNDRRRRAGHKNEKDVAFFLRREFSTDEDVYVLNDVRIGHRGEKAQIDHLVLYPFGFIILESKSIKGRLVVNEFGEWAREYRKEWRGIPSPLRQAEIQSDLLKDYLDAHKKKLMGRIFGFLQKGVRGRHWYAFCAVSSDALIDRRRMTESDSERVIKAEFVGAKLRAVVGEANSMLDDGPPRILNSELKRIVAFLNPTEPTTMRAPNKPSVASDNSPESGTIRCKGCHSDNALQAMEGPYGYYVRCGHCAVNTSMKRRCATCQNPNTTISKRGDCYTLACKQCASEVIIF